MGLRQQQQQGWSDAADEKPGNAEDAEDEDCKPENEEDEEDWETFSAWAQAWQEQTRKPAGSAHFKSIGQEEIFAQILRQPTCSASTREEILAATASRTARQPV